MAIVTSQQISQYYEEYRNTEITFTKDIIRTLAMDPRQIYVICFASSKRGGRPRFTACTAIPHAWDGTWYTSTTQSVITAVYDANTYRAILTTSGMYVRNNVLYTTVA